MVILRENFTGEIVLGLDIEGEGGAIVVAPSLHADGKRYRWRNAAQIADAPEWFLRLLRETQRPRPACADISLREKWSFDDRCHLPFTTIRTGHHSTRMIKANHTYF